jgi:hypothetical protein
VQWLASKEAGVEILDTRPRLAAYDYVLAIDFYVVCISGRVLAATAVH